MNIMEEIFAIRICIKNFEEWYPNQQNWSVYVLQLVKNYKAYTLRDLHPLTGKASKVISKQHN